MERFGLQAQANKSPLTPLYKGGNWSRFLKLTPMPITPTARGGEFACDSVEMPPSLDVRGPGGNAVDLSCQALIRQGFPSFLRKQESSLFPAFLDPCLRRGDVRRDRTLVYE